jgi:co-chaperonin GroES (HSP10)
MNNYYIEYLKVLFHALLKSITTNEDHRIVVEKYLNHKDKLMFKKVLCICDYKKELNNEIMTKKFKVGDRVMYGKSNYIGIYYIHSLHKYTIDEFRVHLSDEKGLAFTSIPLDFIKLVERKIGDNWVKAEDLDKMSNNPFLIKYGFKDAQEFYDFKNKTKDSKNIETNMKINFVKYEDRCKSPHTGSSTCYGCDPEFWLDDDPYKKVEVKITHEQLEELNKGGSRISVGYKINTKGKEKEEFKVDKLGWYESDSGKKFKLLTILNKKGYAYQYVMVNELNSDIHWFDENYTYGSDVLIKYLGPELPKEPRVFEFEAEITEDKSDTNFNKFKNVIGETVGHYTSHFNFIDNFHPNEISENLKISKWHIIMKEVLE